MSGIRSLAENGRFGMKVDSENRAHTFATTQTDDRNLANSGLVWSLYFTATPTATNDYFFYLKNTGTKDLRISDVRIMCASADTFTYEEVSGTASGGSAITPQNRNLGSSKIPSATIESGADITGLTTTGTIFFERAAVANTRYKLSTTSSIHIPQGQSVAFKAATGTALITCVVSLIEAESL